MSIVHKVGLKGDEFIAGFYFGACACFVSDGRLALLTKRDTICIFTDGTMKKMIQLIKVEGVSTDAELSTIRSFYVTRNSKYLCYNYRQTLFVFNLSTYEQNTFYACSWNAPYVDNKVFHLSHYDYNSVHVIDVETGKRTALTPSIIGVFYPKVYCEHTDTLFMMHAMSKQYAAFEGKITDDKILSINPEKLNTNNDTHFFQTKIDGSLVVSYDPFWAVVSGKERKEFPANKQRLITRGPKFALICGGEYAIGFFESNEELVLYNMGKNEVAKVVGTFKGFHPSVVLVSPNLKYAVVIDNTDIRRPELYSISLGLTGVPFVALVAKGAENSQVLFSNGIIATTRPKTISFYLSDDADEATKSNTWQITSHTEVDIGTSTNTVLIKGVIYNNQSNMNVSVHGDIATWKESVLVIKEELSLPLAKRSMTMQEARNRLNFRLVMIQSIQNPNRLASLAQRELLETIQSYFEIKK